MWLANCCPKIRWLRVNPKTNKSRARWRVSTCNTQSNLISCLLWCEEFIKKLTISDTHTLPCHKQPRKKVITNCHLVSPPLNGIWKIKSVAISVQRSYHRSMFENFSINFTPELGSICRCWWSDHMIRHAPRHHPTPSVSISLQSLIMWAVLVLHHITPILLLLKVHQIVVCGSKSNDKTQIRCNSTVNTEEHPLYNPPTLEDRDKLQVFSKVY